MKLVTTTAIATLLAAAGATAAPLGSDTAATGANVIPASADTSDDEVIVGRGAENPRGEDMADEETSGEIVYETVGENSVRDLGDLEDEEQVSTEFDKPLSDVIKEANPVVR